MASHPPLGARLLLAPPAAFHAYAAAMQAIQWSEERDDICAVARRLVASDPRALLREAVPGSPPEMWTVLRRLQPHALILQAYGDLARHLSGPRRDAVMTLPAIGDREFLLLSELERLDPLVTSAFEAVRDGGREGARALDTALQALRRAGVLEPDAEAARILRGLRPSGLWPFVRKRLLRATAAPASFTPRSPLVAVARGAELLQLARRFRNCLASEPAHLVQFVTGACRFMEWRGSEPAVVAVETREHGFFSIVSAFGPRNYPVSSATHEAIAVSLEAVGMRRAPTDLENALCRLHCAALMDGAAGLAVRRRGSGREVRR